MIILAGGNSDILGTWGDALRDSRQVSTASGFEELERMLADGAAVCVAIERCQPHAELIEAVRRLHKLNPLAKIVLLSDPARPCSDQEDLAFLKAGVCGFCRTDMDGDMIRKVLDAVDHGQLWVQRRLIPLLIQELSRQAKGAIDVAPRALDL